MLTILATVVRANIRAALMKRPNHIENKPTNQLKPTDITNQVLLDNATNGIEFEDIQLDTNPILSDLHLHSSGQQLIVATPYKVSLSPFC